MLPVFQVAGSVAQRPGGREQALSQPAWLIVVMSLDLSLGASCYSTLLGAKASVQGSCYFFKQKQKLLSCWLACKAFQARNKNAYVLVWGPAVRMQTQPRGHPRSPAWMDWDACARRKVEDISMQPGNWEQEGVWSQGLSPAV